ncbi:hypothetical protein CJ255_21255 [Candidatus Viridilinea mediisalina]|uniref:DUF4351 domain-containing protein n=1 Tax=Candidatus Viridilinea mediisalina TaxID=2024553 RepID=A0A2A6RD86_9CHLR|nr:hypothetical protein CJ255_21255 [Candidatus Viridilinea mediisalina]
MISKWREEGVAEGIEKGHLELLLRQLVRRCGPLSEPLTRQVQALTAMQMLDLAEALLDFTGRDELEQWLAQRGAETKEG